MIKSFLIRIFFTLGLSVAVSSVAYSHHGSYVAKGVAKGARISNFEPSHGYKTRYVRSHQYQLSQNGRANLRSRSDVVKEVKRRYNAEILKISLDERQQVYKVRVLMPNGKVRNLRISAR